jgi:hypothetical protein
MNVFCKFFFMKTFRSVVRFINVTTVIPNLLAVLRIRDVYPVSGSASPHFVICTSIRVVDPHHFSADPDADLAF